MIHSHEIRFHQADSVDDKQRKRSVTLGRKTNKRKGKLSAVYTRRNSTTLPPPHSSFSHFCRHCRFDLHIYRSRALSNACIKAARHKQGKWTRANGIINKMCLKKKRKKCHSSFVRALYDNNYTLHNFIIQARAGMASRWARGVLPQLLLFI